ncbi:MAG: NAD(P)/FAD-dependent oxidoreductase [Sphingobacteriales bacterium]|nr:MAG: NAD(P)/FAD-dependent oxidoreductase [Sphingobacteriales bacterium]
MENQFEVIIVGGSYSGLSAAMALGRASRKVLIIDSGKPCNRQTPHSHNFLTQDGETPSAIAAIAKEQVTHYPSIKFMEGTAVSVSGSDGSFVVSTLDGQEYRAKKLLFAAGVRDIMPEINGFVACWGISVIHCPYCHGYEVKNLKTGLFSNGDMAYHMVQLLLQWTSDLTLFTNGKSTLTPEQTLKLQAKNITIVETEITELIHSNGQLQSIVMSDGTMDDINVLYAKIAFEQHCPIPKALGCTLDEQGYLAVDDFKKTSIPGIFASGDCTTPGRAVAMAVEAGMRAGVTINMELCTEAF